MSNIVVTGCGTEVGKTIVSAIIATALHGDYWKPVESGCKTDSDTETMKKLLPTSRHRVHPPAYSLEASLSPHHAARLEGIVINPSNICIPKTNRDLIIETAGGVLVPLTNQVLSIDLLQHWNAKWIVVSRHYLGSINHTLLTIEALKQRQINLCGIVFNGEPNQDTEEVILKFSKLPCLGRLLLEKTITRTIIGKYAKQWRQTLLQNMKKT